MAETNIAPQDGYSRSFGGRDDISVCEVAEITDG